MHVIFKVPRIHCSGCVNTVTTAVKTIPGVSTVGASEITKEVKVDFDPERVTEQEIRLQLSRVGYPAA